jgi:hypothetical protein
MDPSHYGVIRALWTAMQTSWQRFREPDDKLLTFQFGRDLAAIANLR